MGGSENACGHASWTLRVRHDYRCAITVRFTAVLVVHASMSTGASEMLTGPEQEHIAEQSDACIWHTGMTCL